jgi:hypothetical protein
MALVKATANVITDIDIRRYLDNQAEVERLKAAYDKARNELDRRETAIVEVLDAGGQYTGGAYELQVLTRRRQSVSWLTAYRNALGEAAVISVKDSWPTTFWKELQVSQRG